MTIDKSWTSIPNRNSEGFLRGLHKFLEHCKAFLDPISKEIACPCNTCGNSVSGSIETLLRHISENEFDKTYTFWNKHGEPLPLPPPPPAPVVQNTPQPPSPEYDNMAAFLNDIRWEHEATQPTQTMGPQTTGSTLELSTNEGDPGGCKSKKIPFKTDKDIVREVIQSTNRGHETGVGRMLPGTSSRSSSLQPASGYCTQEEADRLRKENEELKKAVQSQQLEWLKFVNHFNAHQTCTSSQYPVPSLYIPQAFSSPGYTPPNLDGYRPTYEDGSTSQIVHDDDLDGDDLDVDGDGSGSLDGDDSGSLDGDSDDDSNDASDEEEAEAEYRGVANAVAETCWVRNLLRVLHTPLSSATIVYCDNVSAVYLSSNPVQHQRTKHIEIDIHFVRDLVATGQVRVLHVPSRFQYADIFTKGLPSALFEEFRTSLSVRCPPAPTAGEYSVSKMTVIWNPCIRKCVSIVIPNELPSPYGHTAIGFGVCPDTSDPTLVKIQVNRIKKPYAWVVEVFTLNGIIYWRNVDLDEGLWSNYIISFDLKREKFDEVYLPERLAPSHGFSVLAKVNESLRLLEYYNEGEIWVCGVWTKKDGVGKPFTKIYTVKVEGKSLLNSALGWKSVLGFRNNGEDDNDTGYAVEVYEPSCGHISGVGINDKYVGFSAVLYMETLLLLHESNSIIH
ncbi:ribonuclease H-like domain-containing protein [Tanacetum coccineum]